MVQEVQAELGATQQLLARCQSSFETLVQHYGEHPASMHDLEFWRDVQTFVAALSAAQQRHETQTQVWAVVVMREPRKVTLQRLHATHISQQRATWTAIWTSH